ncbi:MAG TPA: flagellar export chaperone FliS [Solimonas sp.]|nr:flagellar export chaperone FliS [Solimonas sp.]
MSLAALRQYQTASTAAANGDASSHQLVDMLYAGVLERMAIARGAAQRGEREAKRKAITGTLEIVSYLRAVLDHDRGGEIARRLSALYDYIGTRLVQANASDDVAALDEVAALIREIRSAWEAVAPRR